MTFKELIRHMLVEKWTKLMADMHHDPLDTFEFKEIFKKTWLYFIDVVKNDSLDLEDIVLINQVHNFSDLIFGFDFDLFETADKNDCWDKYFICQNYVDALLDNIPKKSFATGELIIKNYRFTMIVYLDGFDIIFDDDLKGESYERDYTFP